MYIDQGRKIVFIHNPKTAGRSIIKAFGFNEIGPMQLCHITSIVAIGRVLQGNWDTFYSFCFVRDPIDRYHSLYNFQRSTKYGLLLNSNFSHEIARKYDFCEWMDFNIDAPFKSNWFGLPQASWYDRVQHVFQFEAMPTALDHLSRDLKLELPTLFENTGDYVPLDRSSLTNRAKAFVYETDRQVYDRFHYSHD